SRLEDLETEDVAGFAWAFATAGRSSPKVFQGLAAYADRYAGRFRPEELHVLSWAFAEVGCSVGGRFTAASTSAAQSTARQNTAEASQGNCQNGYPSNPG
ncbi:unnamed protein product, partial [Polarella glacialis]